MVDPWRVERLQELALLVGIRCVALTLNGFDDVQARLPLWVHLIRSYLHRSGRAASTNCTTQPPPISACFQPCPYYSLNDTLGTL